MELPLHIIEAVVAQALAEDIGHGDLTTQTAIPAAVQSTAHIVTREAGVVAGLPVVIAVFHQLDPRLKVLLHVDDGATVAAGTKLATVVGSARSILSGERVALNLLQRLSGIATMTAQYVAAVANTKAKILDTRKTTPGLRALEKYAVRVGGGYNHRFGLYDGVMLKDNHLAILAAQGIDLVSAIKQVRQHLGPMVQIEVEVESVDAAIAAAEAGADLILLDNMPLDQLRLAVQAIAGRAKTEASGGVTLQTVRAIAETGVDYISVGALTHSVRALDIGLDCEG
ncbi:carboxylating nicotinate-nucleotide diphosphorylase [Chloroflexus sp. MS-CIW-1]|jgi:nicotinate-nucleotide pyrophosphorylase (carboxylating)|uniref:carboxylating nicotinate-nucleotide diphosphorylase n=1 Tax=unclassified Chloroflexus TaxID=2633855 RepID=UPI0004DEF280|nr:MULTISPECIES: carboxylating nicotinate-nucleotide diphosphorylase [unclassified Chloroflexus]MBO9337175.1 carboxylating nicotinate-nucleotide diphosphorylase [Chloroflexus sp.]MBO9346658.1 carboxylating nicotinate-nucleotide diphosphorylase [Chloroflexus sp.]MDN5271504.1 carboxylating nicotinate-nucleotide diphosphorylase [Chloroflexus sp. MS-CIW-1]